MKYMIDVNVTVDGKPIARSVSSGIARQELYDELFGSITSHLLRTIEMAEIVFTEEQRALIIAAAEEQDAAFEIFGELCKETDPVKKLQMLEPYHEAELRVIELLRQAGDPAADQRLAHRIGLYQDMRTQYERLRETPPPPRTPAQEWADARCKLLRGYYTAKLADERHEAG
jgi:hypothetical protein